MHGRFGAYVQLGETPDDENDEKPRRASLGRDFTEDTITLADALKLLSLPRELGTGDDGEPIVANVGRFGPYVKHGSEFRSLEADDDVYTITLERAKELLAQPKKSMRRQRAGAEGAEGARQASRQRRSRCASSTAATARTSPTATTNASLPKGTAPEALTHGRRRSDAARRRARGSSKSKAPRRGARPPPRPRPAPATRKEARLAAVELHDPHHRRRPGRLARRPGRPPTRRRR